MKFSKKILETFIDLPANWRDLMEDVGLEVKSVDGDIINLELLANRGDHYCYRGVAREINGRNSAKITPREYIDVEFENAGPDAHFGVETKKCLGYALTPFNLKNTPKGRQTTNKYITTMLPASGVNLILDVIDVTNVVMLEYGQPAHVYDADKVVGKITVRDSKPGESAALLFHEGMTELPTGTCVISDDEKILCVAGVIGCRAAEVDENTKNILFETALFDPVSIRKTARALGVSSIASQIFERGGNWDAIRMGVDRAKKLYLDIGWEQSGNFKFIHEMHDVKNIKMTGDFVRDALGIKISDSEIDERLARYGFDKTQDGYAVPSWRAWDIRGTSADLIEELCRSIGYDNLPSKMPPVENGVEPSESWSRRNEIDSYMVHNGFYEVFTDNLYSPKHAKLSPLSEHISLENSIDGGYSFLKNNMIVQAAELVAKNINVKNREIRSYEWGKIFKDKNEYEILWGVMNGVGVSSLSIKGIVENLLNGLNLDFRLEYDFENQGGMEWNLLMPKRRAKIYLNNACVGWLGEISPELTGEFGIKNDAPVYFCIFGGSLLNTDSVKHKYQSPSLIIPSVRDIAVTVPYGKHAGDVADFITKNYPTIASVKIVDVFDKPRDSVRNVTFSLTFKGEHSAEELNKLILEIMNKSQDSLK